MLCGKIKQYIIRSEDFNTYDVQKELMKQLVNPSIFFYEGNLLYEKAKLKKDLRALIRMIDDL